MDFPCKVGITMPDEIKERYETEPREYLIGSRCKGIWGGSKVYSMTREILVTH